MAHLDDAAQPRTISANQEARIASRLKAFAGQEVDIKIYAQEHEARMLGEQVSASLLKAGLKPRITQVAGTAGQGFAVALHDTRSAPRLADAIQRAFRSAGLKLDFVALPGEVTEGKFFVFIGENSG